VTPNFWGKMPIAPKHLGATDFKFGMQVFRDNTDMTPNIFYPRDAILARVIVIATCPSVRLSVRLSRAGIVSKRRKLAA